MNLDLLTAISPIDGRYRGKTEQLANYFSEYALIRYRVRVEIEYFITLCELPLPQLASFDQSLFERLRDIYRNFNENDAQRVKDIEKVTNHDVKAVEYFIKEEFDKKMEKYHMETAEVTPQSERTTKKFEKQYLKTDTGIEINIPMEQYQDADQVEFITNPDGTISVLIKNINKITTR